MTVGSQNRVPLGFGLWAVCLCIGVAGCTSISSYEPTTRAPPMPPPPGFETQPFANEPADAGAGASGAEPSLPVPSAVDHSNQAVIRQENAASVALLQQSRYERAAGSYGEAAASIERALRIDPNNPALWIELAEIKAAERDYAQAEMMARKALTLAGSDRSIMARAERLLD